MREPQTRWLLWTIAGCSGTVSSGRRSLPMHPIAPG